MKNAKNILMTMIFLALSCIAEELIKNGDFEQGMNFWSSPQKGASSYPIHNVVETENGKCMKIIGNPESEKSKQGFNLCQRARDIKPDQTYRFFYRYRAQIPNTELKRLVVELYNYGEKDKLLYIHRQELGMKENDWKFDEILFTPSKGTINIEVVIRACGLEKSDAFFLDDIRLETLSSPGAAFAPDKTTTPKRKMLIQDSQLQAIIDSDTGLLANLTLLGENVQPAAENSTVLFVQSQNKETMLNGLGKPCADVPFTAKATYSVHDGCLQEKVVFTATADSNTQFTLGVRHGMAPGWQDIICGESPVRQLPADKVTVFTYRQAEDSLNPSILDAYQNVVYPMLVFSNSKNYLLVSSFDFDTPITTLTNSPAGYAPIWQRSPLKIKAGQTFEFETNWRLFPKKENMLRDVWRYQVMHLHTSSPLLKPYLPVKYTGPRRFGTGCSGSITYFMKEREDRLFPQSTIWYDCHDYLNETYPTSGEWWSNGNLWNGKMKAEVVRQNIKSLMERDLKVIMYIRIFTNLNLLGKAYPANWVKRTPGGGVHMYGGGYVTKLPSHVAKDVGYDSIQWGSLDVTIPECKNMMVDSYFKAMDFYKPYAIGWDCMCEDPADFHLVAEVYDRIQKEKLPFKVVGNECTAHLSTYMDEILNENGLLGGKTPLDFEVSRAFNVSYVCLERFNIFQDAIKVYRTGKRTWLSSYGLAFNKRFFDYLLTQHPELKDDDVKAAQLCQMRAYLYDLALGASGGYMEEAKPVPNALVDFNTHINNMFRVDESFALQFPNGIDSDGPLAASAWAAEDEGCRLALFNDDTQAHPCHLKLSRKIFEPKKVTLAKLNNAKCFLVTTENQKRVSLSWKQDADSFILETELPIFTALLVTIDK